MLTTRYTGGRVDPRDNGLEGRCRCVGTLKLVFVALGIVPVVWVVTVGSCGVCGGRVAVVRARKRLADPVPVVLAPRTPERVPDLLIVDRPRRLLG